jgi:hypothetical protein
MEDALAAQLSEEDIPELVNASGSAAASDEQEQAITCYPTATRHPLRAAQSELALFGSCGGIE